MQLIFEILFPITMLAAWFTHVTQSIADNAWGLLLVGIVFFPIGIIHGIGIWFGVF